MHGAGTRGVARGEAVVAVAVEVEVGARGGEDGSAERKTMWRLSLELGGGGRFIIRL
jgi:hypothetical protein